MRRRRVAMECGTAFKVAVLLGFPHRSRKGQIHRAITEAQSLLRQWLLVRFEPDKSDDREWKMEK